jgi:hypothetical protein
MCDVIIQYIEDNKDKKTFFDIYNELIKNNNKDDVQFVFSFQYNFDIENCIKTEYELKEKRFYQQKLRKESLEFYNNKCVISNINRNLCLEIAHIKPVCECKNTKEKMDVENTFLLWIDLHKYFDAYCFSINPDTYKIEVKKNCEDYEWLKQYDNKKINLTDKNKLYLQHHYTQFEK